MIVLDLSDLITLGTTTTTTCNNDGIHLSTEEIATTLTSSMTTASTNSGPSVHVHASAARDYVSSMSVEERDDLLLQIDERIAVLSDSQVEMPKVKKLGTMDNKKI